MEKFTESILRILVIDNIKFIHTVVLLSVVIMTYLLVSNGISPLINALTIITVLVSVACESVILYKHDVKRQ